MARIIIKSAGDFGNQSLLYVPDLYSDTINISFKGFGGSTGVSVEDAEVYPLVRVGANTSTGSRSLLNQHSFVGYGASHVRPPQSKSIDRVLD